MARLYTTEEAYRKLGVSQATFYRWATEAKEEGFGEKIEPQPSVDGRERLYTVPQLRWLALRHSKVLLPDEELFVHEPQLEVESLRRDVIDLKQQIDEKGEEGLQLKSDMHNMQRELLAMDAKVQQVSQVVAEMKRVRRTDGGVSPLHTPSPVSAEAGEGGQSSAMHQQQKKKTGNKVLVTSASATDASSGVKRFERSSRSESTSTPSQELHTWSEAELFEENWIDENEGRLVSRARMAKAHGIPETNLRRDIEVRHVLEMVKKKWLYKGAWKVGGFNAAQRRRVWEEYHQMSWFHPCEICERNQHAEN